MKKPKSIPVNISFTKSGDLLQVINEFQDLMSNVTNGEVDVNIDLKGKVTIYFEQDPRPTEDLKPPKAKKQQYPYDLESLYLNNVEYRNQK